MPAEKPIVIGGIDTHKDQHTVAADRRRAQLRSPYGLARQAPASQSEPLPTTLNLKAQEST